MTAAARVASFRDPSGRLFVLDDRVVRWVDETGRDELEAYLSSRTIQQAIADGKAVATRPLEPGDGETATGVEDMLEQVPDAGRRGSFVEHDRIPFPSYPYEWPAPMLEAAAGLTLDLQQGLIAEGLGLKDASAYNILFDGPRPVFIDALSVEKRDPHDAIWSPEAQFVRMFLLPLLVARDRKTGLFDVLINHRDGLEPEEVYKATPRLRRLRSPYRWLVTLPTWLAGKAESKGETLYQAKPMKDPKQARYVLKSSASRLRKQLRAVTKRRAKGSHWSRYMQQRTHYDDEDAARKDAFVRDALQAGRPRWVLDVGCNTGHFSAMAAESGARVVAIDKDPESVGALWRRAHHEKRDILPLVVDLSRPTPAMGWRNAECPAFLERAEHRFDMVLFLAVIHHLNVTERIPLEEIIKVAKRLTRRDVIMEYVGPEDPMFRRLLRGRGHLHGSMTRARFEGLLENEFHVTKSRPMEGTDRVLYLLRRLDATDDATGPPPQTVNVPANTTP